MLKKLLSLCAAVALVAALAACAQAPEDGGAGASDQAAADAAQGAAEGIDPAAGSAADTGADADTAADATRRSYVVAHVDGQPNWDDVAQIDIDNKQWLEPVDIAAHAQLCYSDDAFYVRMWAEEADVRAEYPASDLLANAYEDSCLEFFLSPVPGDARYLNFEFNPNSAVCLQIGTTRNDRTRLVRTDDPFEAVTARTDDGWEIVYRVPFDFIRSFYPDFAAESGMQLRGNFYKCGNLTAQKHYLSWSPVDSDVPNFHLPESFGVLVLE